MPFEPLRIREREVVIHSKTATPIHNLLKPLLQKQHFPSMGHLKVKVTNITMSFNLREQIEQFFMQNIFKPCYYPNEVSICEFCDKNKFLFSKELKKLGNDYEVVAAILSDGFLLTKKVKLKQIQENTNCFFTIKERTVSNLFFTLFYRPAAS